MYIFESYTRSLRILEYTFDQNDYIPLFIRFLFFFFFFCRLTLRNQWYHRFFPLIFSFFFFFNIAIFNRGVIIFFFFLQSIKQIRVLLIQFMILISFNFQDGPGKKMDV